MKKYLVFILSGLFCLFSNFAGAGEIPSRPVPPQLVNDFANVLSSADENSLETELADFARSTSTQIVVVTVNSLEDDIANFAFELGEKWGVGQKGENNGIVMIIKPKVGNERGQAFIAVGYGLEEVVTDAASKLIVDHDMIPHFKENNYYAGIAAGVKVLMELCEQLYSSDEYVDKAQSADVLLPIFGFIMMIIFISIIFGSKSNKNSGNVTFGGGILPWILLGGGHSNSSDWSDFSSGSGHFGGSSGRGFGGFGGGSFGGGGAGGSW